MAARVCKAGFLGRVAMSFDDFMDVLECSALQSSWSGNKFDTSLDATNGFVVTAAVFAHGWLAR